MAVTKLTCPECKTVLKTAKPVPAGKAVKCPECGNRFTAGEDEREAPQKKPKKAAEQEPALAEAGPKKSGDKKASPKKPGDKKASAAKKSDAKKTDDDEDGGTYTFAGEDDKDDKPDINYAPDMSTKDLRGPAASALVQPSNALIITGGLGFFGWLTLLILILIPVLFPIDNDEGDKTKPPKPVIGMEHGLSAVNSPQAPPPDMKSDPSRKAMFNLFGVNLAYVGILAWYFFILALSPIFIGMIYSAIITYGAVKIQNLEGRGWGIAASIMVMAPLNSGGFMSSMAIILTFLLGMLTDDLKWVYGVLMFLMGLVALLAILVGVWTLVTLLSEKVIKGYEYKAE